MFGPYKIIGYYTNHYDNGSKVEMIFSNETKRDRFIEQLISEGKKVVVYYLDKARRHGQYTGVKHWKKTNLRIRINNQMVGV